MAGDVTVDDILDEIADYFSEPDYYAEGYRTTREIAERLGMTVENTIGRLERAAREGVMEKVQDKSKKSWWRMKGS